MRTIWNGSSSTTAVESHLGSAPSTCVRKVSRHIPPALKDEWQYEQSAKARAVLLCEMHRLAARSQLSRLRRTRSTSYSSRFAVLVGEPAS
jgi:hypothetical protein